MILLWRITSTCNFACGFCAYDRRLKLPPLAADPAEVERFARLVAEAAAGHGERLLLSWLGGEPMLWPPLFDLSHRLGAEPAIVISATTNGSRLGDAAVRRRILSDFTELTLSVDGLGAVHDRLRGAPGSFARIERGIAALVAERAALGSALKIRINSVIMHQTVDQFGDLCRTLAEWGVDEITFNQLGGRDRPPYFAEQYLRPADAMRLRAMIPELRADIARLGVRLCADPLYLDRIAASSRGEPLPIAECGPGEAFLFVDERGLVAPCSFTVDQYGVPVAELRTVEQVAGLPARFRQARAATRSPDCDDCPSTQMFGKFAVGQ